MEKLRIGVLGSGDIATRVSNTFLNMDDVEMYAVASRNYEHARAFGEKFGYLHSYQTYEEVMEDPNVDLVYIALHHTQHYEFAQKCLKYKKPVLCEKPFTINHYQTEKLFLDFKEQDVFICEALWTRFLPARKWMEDILEKEIIGKLKMIDVNMICNICDNIRMTDIHMGGGALLDLGVYALNFASMFFGEEEKMLSIHSAWKTGVDEQEAVLLQYSDGRIAVCKICMSGCGNAKGVIYGTKGRIEVSDVMNFDRIEVYDQDNRMINKFSKEENHTGYEYEFRACKKALEKRQLECEEMSHEATLSLIKKYDKLRNEWGLAYPCERGL